MARRQFHVFVATKANELNRSLSFSDPVGLNFEYRGVQEYVNKEQLIEEAEPIYPPPSWIFPVPVEQNGHFKPHFWQIKEKRIPYAERRDG